MQSNSTLPCTISSVRVVNAPNTRRSFLESIFAPLLKANNDRPYTLAEALQQVDIAAGKLRRFDIFQEPISPFIDKPSKTDPSTTPTDFDVYLPVKEKSRITLKTGTDIGNTEGSAYVSLLYRNLFGGAENLNVNGSYGTRTRSSYNATFTTPLFSNPDIQFELGGVSSATQNNWASHEEVLKAGWTKLRWLSGLNQKHEFSYDGAWRQITGLASNASPTVRTDAGDSVKSSISHAWTADYRDNPLLPQSGVYAKATNEIAGCGLLRGDVCFWKSQIETQSILPIPLPGVEESGITFSTGLRAGLLYPLSSSTSGPPQASRLPDRFQLGGPNDVRGFRLGGLGPRDGNDAVGGDILAAGSANLLFPLPGVGPKRPLRAQLFINGGRLLALKEGSGAGEDRRGSSSVQKSVKSTIQELSNGLPSTAAGIGLVYAHPVARFELNFSLPLILRKGEDARKGLSFGVGINFL